MLTAEEVEVEGLALVEAYGAARRAYGEWRPPPNPCVQVMTGEVDPIVREYDCAAMVTLPMGDVTLVGLPLPMFPPFASVWVWHRYLLRLAVEDAWGEIEMHLRWFGPIETENEIYKIDSVGALCRRAKSLPFACAARSAN